MKLKLLFLLIIGLISFWGKAQIITTIAGNGTPGYKGDGGFAPSAELDYPTGVCIDTSGNIYIADQGNYVIRKVNPSGIITTVAGNGKAGYSGDGGDAKLAEFNYIMGMCVDISGNIYLADYYNQCIRMINPAGIITTVAGNGIQGFSGDGGPATAAELFKPNNVCVDTSGNLYIVDTYNERIRKVSSTGIITTVAGNGIQGYSGDGGLATAAALLVPQSVCVDLSGNLYIADGDSRIRMVNSAGIITTIAGNGIPGFSGDGGAANQAQINLPRGICTDIYGNLYIGDGSNARVRKITPSGLINTIAGNGVFAYSGDGGLATSAELIFPMAVCIDAKGNLYIADPDVDRIRKVMPGSLPVQFLSFTAQFMGNDAVSLQWQTASEINTSYFNIQRSNTWKDFVTVGTVNAKGTGSYSFNDQSILWGAEGLLYYRLEIVDKDGSKTYSEVRELTIDNEQWIIYPNPARSSVVINGKHISEVRVSDVAGRVLINQSYHDAVNPVISTSGLAMGVYYVTVVSPDGKMETKKMVKE